MQLIPVIDVLNAATIYLSNNDPIMGRVITEIGPYRWQKNALERTGRVLL